MKVLLSLFDYTGNWSLPYRENGWIVRQVDRKLGEDVLQISPIEFVDELLGGCGAKRVNGILAAPPCDDFASSGAQYWVAKDSNGRTSASVRLVQKALDFVYVCKPDFWAIENPVGRLPKLLPLGRGRFFHPYWHGDAYSKRTGLWGDFVWPWPTNMIEPKMGKNGSPQTQSLSGWGNKTKTIRSTTPLGFAWAFYGVNH